VPMDRAEQRRHALALLRGHGWATVSFQLLEADFEYWFDGDDAFVAYVDTGGAWVAGGPPIAPPDRLVAVTNDFVEAARAAGRRASFFACEQRFVDAVGGPSLLIGEQPVWNPAEWDAVLADPEASSLRYQLRRAKKKGVVVREVTAAEVADKTSPVHRAVESLAATWMAGRGMAPMRFLVQLEPLTFADERVLFVATKGDEIVGFLSAVPVYARRRLFVEDMLRAPHAPNGTIELLVDAAMRAAHARDDAGVTLGLAPLAGDVAPLLRLARRVSAPLYDFRGLHAFKARLLPRTWEPVYLCAPGGSTMVALHDGLAAFAGGSLVRFGLATVVKNRWLLAAAILGFVLVALAVTWMLFLR
jgi:phosphatidylglycerol lysyltransferase